MFKSILVRDLEFLLPGEASDLFFPFVDEYVSAGFPSPADDFQEMRISLDRELINDKEATFFIRVRGDSMRDADLSYGDLLVVDKSMLPLNGYIAICFLDDEFTVKRIKKDNDSLWLVPENPEYKPIEVSPESTLQVWGIVTYIIKSATNRKF